MLALLSHLQQSWLDGALRTLEGLRRGGSGHTLGRLEGQEKGSEGSSHPCGRKREFPRGFPRATPTGPRVVATGDLVSGLSAPALLAPAALTADCC
jgi:hypothetical protein